MRHHHLQHQISIKSNKLQSTLLNLCENFLLSITAIIAKKCVRKIDVITFFAHNCAVREKLDIIVSVTPAQTWGRFCDYYYHMTSSTCRHNFFTFMIL